MRILFIHEVGYFEKPIFEMHEFPEYLALSGHEIGFLDMREAHGRRVAVFGQKETGRVVPGVRLSHYSQPTYVKGIFRRLLSVFTFSTFFKAVLFDFKPDVVVSFSVPTSGWQALNLCRSQGIPYVFRALDVSHKIRRTAFSALIKFAERYIYKNANWVSCNNPAMQSYCISLGAKLSESSVDFPPLDMSHFSTSKTLANSLRTELGMKKDVPVVVYMGSFFYFSGLEEVIKSMATLKSEAHLLLIGGGEQELELRRLTGELGLENRVTFSGFVPFGQLPTYLSIADVAINPLVPSLVSHTALPNKVLQYMASHLPVVSTRLKGLSSVFPAEPGLVYVDSPRDIFATASWLVATGDLKELGRSNSTAVREKFDVLTNTRNFAERLTHEVVSNRA